MIQNINFEIAKNTDINGVLALQELYLVSNLSDDEKKNGFVTTPFSVDQLTSVIGNEGLFVAKVNNKIIAYIFAESWLFFKQYPIFEYMISLFPKFLFNDYHFTTQNSFQYGPICIHQDYRGKGLIVPFFEFMRKNVVEKYPLSLTFINKINIPSFKAHTEKLNWNVIDEFQFNNNEYFVLAYDMNIALK
jgi:hypothetical protein